MGGDRESDRQTQRQGQDTGGQRRQRAGCPAAPLVHGL